MAGQRMTDPTPAAGGLTEAEQEALTVARHTGTHSELVAAVERIIAARTEAAGRERDEWRRDALLAREVSADRQDLAARLLETEHDRDEWKAVAHDGAFQQSRAEAAEREAARIAAAVEAVADKWDADRLNRAIDKEAAADNLRAALSSADTTADDLLDRERAKAAGEALREAAEAWPREVNAETIRREMAVTNLRDVPEPYTSADWLRDRADAVSPEGGDA